MRRDAASSASRQTGPVPFALRLVTHKKTRTAVAAAGIGFAILVIFVQLGFYSAVTNTALAVSSRLNAELVLISPRFVHLAETGTIPRGRLFQSLAVPAVQAAIPVYVRNASWRDPLTGERCRLFALGVPIADAIRTPPLLIAGITEQLDALRPTNTLLLDRLTQADCGPTDPRGHTEVRDQAARVVGQYDLGVGFLADGSMVVSDDTFTRLFRNHPLSEPHLGLIQLQPGYDVEVVAARLRSSLPGDVRVVTRAELNRYQTDHWVENTAVGNIFGMGSIAGFLVGVVVLFQILSTDIRNHLPLYATLRAMGYSNRQLYGYVLQQAWIFAGLGYLPALAISLALFPFVHSLTRLPIFMTFSLAGFVLVMSFVMCSAAAFLSMRRLRLADPAELF